ncbi:energy transducer TonB, partial [Dysgonomonas sp. UBA7698]
TCDKEAMRVIKSMPKWIPGKQSGNPVQVYFTIPIVFKLKQ